MKKRIEVKGLIDVDKTDMKQIRAGESCGQGEIACRNVMPGREQLELDGYVVVDKLKFS